MALELQEVKPDWDALVLKLQQSLSQPGREAWADLFPGGTGQTLLEAMAAVGVYNQHGVESAFLETFLLTARRPTSLYALTRTLGTRISRKISPSVTVRVSRQTTGTPLVIPAWTEWATYDNGTLVNVEPIVFDTNDLNLNVTLYLGTVQEYRHLSEGGAFQEMFVSGSEPFSISDQHLTVTVNNVAWRIVYDGLWNYGTADRVVVDATDNQGNLVLLFGDDEYGTAPNAGEIVVVRWLDTRGTRSPQLLVGTELTSTISGITGVTLATQASGGNEKDPEFYRRMAPFIFTERDKPVTAEGYTAKCIQYPSVVDAVVLFQRDVDPYDLRMMNVAYVTLLLESGGSWAAEVDTPSPPMFFFVANGSQYLAPGTYSYRISAVNAVGESLACPTTSYVVGTPGSLLLRWDTVENAVTYRVYGRTSGAELFLAEVRPSDLDQTLGRVHWYDDGRTYPNGALPGSNTTRANWWTFVQWMERYKHDSLRLIQRVPTARPVNIKINAYLFRDVEDAAAVRQQIYERLVELFRPKLGLLGRSFALSDLVTAAKVPRDNDPTRSYVDYVEIVEPVIDQVVSAGVAGRTEYFYMASLAISMGYTTRVERFE